MTSNDANMRKNQEKILKIWEWLGRHGDNPPSKEKKTPSKKKVMQPRNSVKGD